jgi:hypothetical protein
MAFGNDDDEMSDSVHSKSSRFDDETSDDDMSRAGSFQPPKKARKKRLDLGWREVQHCANIEEARLWMRTSAKATCDGLIWICDGAEKGKKQGVTNYCCAFKHDSKCQCKCRILRDWDTGKCIVQETCSIQHADHRIKHSTVGLHKLVKAEFLKSGSSLLHAKTREIRKVIMDMNLPDENNTQAFRACQYRQRQRKKEVSDFIDKDSVGTWGGVNQWCLQNTKTAISKTLMDRNEIFDSNTPYILPGWVVDADAERCIIVHTTENLMLNAYRSSLLHKNNKTLLALDHTYRLVHEGHATLVVATVAPDQSSHAIAYATCSDEATAGIVQILQAMLHVVHMQRCVCVCVCVSHCVCACDREKVRDRDRDRETDVYVCVSLQDIATEVKDILCFRARHGILI